MLNRILKSITQNHRFQTSFVWKFNIFTVQVQYICQVNVCLYLNVCEHKCIQIRFCSSRESVLPSAVKPFQVCCIYLRYKAVLSTPPSRLRICVPLVLSSFVYLCIVNHLCALRIRCGIEKICCSTRVLHVCKSIPLNRLLASSAFRCKHNTVL